MGRTIGIGHMYELKRLDLDYFMTEDEPTQ
jgi:hypothetical protein